MIRFGRVSFYITVATLLIWQLSQYYVFLTLKPVRAPFTMYSLVFGDFVITWLDENKQLYRCDTKGNTYTQWQVNSLLPSLYIHQLMVDKCFPDTIYDKAVSLKDIQLTDSALENMPSAINAPQTGLYLLMESISKRVDLKMSEDVFRFANKGMKLIHMKTNRIDEAKSKLFTDMLIQKEFVFSANYASGDLTTCKNYDEGYLVLDINHELFHLKRTKRHSYVRAIQLPEGVLPEYVFTAEFRSCQTLRYMVDSKHHFYVTDSDGSLMKSTLPSFNPARDELTIFGGMFDWTVELSTDKDDYYYALDAADYSLVKEHACKGMHRSVPRLSFTSSDDKFVVSRF